MTSLEGFLKKNKSNPEVVVSEPASGSFKCQFEGCDEVIYEGYIDRVHSRIHWSCSQGHDSSVII